MLGGEEGGRLEVAGWTAVGGAGVDGAAADEAAGGAAGVKGAAEGAGHLGGCWHCGDARCDGVEGHLRVPGWSSLELNPDGVKRECWL